MTIPDFPESECERVAARFREAAAQLRAAALECVESIRELQRTGAHYRAGAASVREFAERNGLSWSEARTLEHVARAIEGDPSLPEEIRKGTISLTAAAVLGEVARLPETSRKPEDRWVEWAKTMDSRRLRRVLEERRDEARAGEPVIPMVAYVTSTARDDMLRARVLASRPAHTVLTIGQTIGIVFAEWLARNDPLRRTPGKRRVPDTNTRPDSRYVPAEVDRAVRARNEDRCIVPMCDHAYWVERSHRVPHRDGSGRETGDLDPLCDYHNLLYERGDIRISGPPEAPLVTDRFGRSLSEKRPWRPDRDGERIPVLDDQRLRAPPEGESEPGPNAGPESRPGDEAPQRSLPP